MVRVVAVSLNKGRPVKVDPVTPWHHAGYTFTAVNRVSMAVDDLGSTFIVEYDDGDIPTIRAAAAVTEGRDGRAAMCVLDPETLPFKCYREICRVGLEWLREQEQRADRNGKPAAADDGPCCEGYYNGLEHSLGCPAVDAAKGVPVV